MPRAAAPVKLFRKLRRPTRRVLILRAAFRALLDNRLVHELTDERAVIALRRSRHRLRHDHANERFLRIDPEPRARGAAPVVFARGTGDGVHAGLLADLEAEPETVPGLEQRDRRLDRAEMIRRHVTHRCPAEEPGAVELTTVRQHLHETRVVAGRPGRAGAAGIIHLRQRDVQQRYTLFAYLVSGD